MSNTTNYTKTENAIVSASALMSNLTHDNVQALELQAALNMNPPIVLGTTGSYALKTCDLIQAAIGKQLVNVQASTGAILSVGLDTANNALAYIGLFNLAASGINYSRVLSFQVDQGYGPATGVNAYLGTTSSTNTYIRALGFGVGPTGAAILIPSSGPAGAVYRVEVYATSVSESTPGVTFNVL